ncbi:MAG: hypothetical protein IPG60_14010 [Bacteroidetes bacterium]|nr:hypothetical protein [Bacteroidota bacterium]
MTRNMGIWIDGSKAVIIELNGDEAIIQEVLANVDYRERIPGEGKTLQDLAISILTWNTERNTEYKISENIFG